MANLKVVDAEQLEADLTSVADSIRAKTGGEEKLAFPSGFMSALDTIESADSALAEVEYLMSNGYTDYSYFFYEKRNMTKIPYEIFKNHGNAMSMIKTFYYCESLTEIIELDVSNAEDLSGLFSNCKNLTYVPMLNTSKCINFRAMFYYCFALKTIEGIDLTNAAESNFYNMFIQCNKIENITFYGHIKITGLDLSPCTLLTHDSLMSAINALYDYASEGTTGTFKLVLGSTNKAKLTEDEQYIATSKGWTLS